MSSYIQVAGMTRILVGFPYDDYATMHLLGEQVDETKLTIEQVLHDVYADSQGGPQGDPIEQQVLALRIRGSLNLSKWDPEIRRKLIQHNLMTTEGQFSDAEIGGLLLRDRSFRFAFSPSKSNPIPASDFLTSAADPDEDKDLFFYNFPCCTVSAPIETGQSTKYSMLNFDFRAWRVPEDHLLAPADPSVGLIYNRDATGIDDKYLPLTMKVT